MVLALFRKHPIKSLIVFELADSQPHQWSESAQMTKSYLRAGEAKPQGSTTSRISEDDAEGKATCKPNQETRQSNGDSSDPAMLALE